MLAARAPHAHGGQPASVPSMKGSENKNNAIVSNTVPTKSTPGGFLAFDSSKVREAARIVTSPRGRLMRKMGLQTRWNRSAWFRKPPKICPTIEPNPIIAPRMQKARLFDDQVKL